jgi:hypothetical protein
MSDIVKLNDISEKMIELRNKIIILDSDIAVHYGVETRDINKAVKNNPDKFPDEMYIFEVSKQEFADLRCKNSTANISPMTRVLPKAFTEKGLYMLATILKSPQATEKTIEIIEAFANMREFSRTINQMAKEPDKEKQKPLMKRCGEILGDLISNDLEITDVETTIELNFAMVLKYKRTTKRSKK